VDALQAQINVLKAQIGSLGTGKAAAGQVATLKGQIAALQKQRNTTGADVLVVQQALQPGGAYSPRTGRDALIGLIAGLVLAGLAVLVRDRSNSRPHSGSELEQLWGLPVLASVRDVGEGEALAPATIDAFRALRSNLLLRGDGSLPRVLLVTSAVESAERSAVTASLSRALTAGGRRVVAVSADSRAPALNEKMAVESSTGLAEVLEHDVYPTDVVTPVPLAGGLDGGQAGALDLLASDSRPDDLSTSIVGHAMEDLLDDLQEEYDIVVIDAPAILPASETALLARAPGIATLIVGSVGGAKRAEIEQARSRLALARVEPVGLVVCGSA
jgi:Mrp family chromosome partitioning ATPase